MKTMEKLKDLLEEAKGRTILWAMLVTGLAYLLSLTSSSIWLNIPIAMVILVVIRYLSFEFEIHKRVQMPKIPSHLSHLLKYQLSLEDPLLCSPPISISWKRKIDSPVVEAAVDSFTHRIVQEFVTDLWYSSLSPNQDVPEQLCLLINDIFGELAQRVKRINLVSLLTRDIVDLVGNHIELFRKTKATIKMFDSLSSEEREDRLRSALWKKNQLHPALVSPESECKVLQQLMGGVVAILLRPQDAQCPLLRGLARELLACAVLRPVMNFASPGFINKAIEKATLAAKEKAQKRADTSTAAFNVPKEDTSKAGGSRTAEAEARNPNKYASTSNRSEHSSSGLEGPTSGRHEDRAQVLDGVSERRTRTLATENLDNLWTKGHNYRRKDLERTTAKANPGLSGTVVRTSETPGKSSFERQEVRPTLKDSTVNLGLAKVKQASLLGDTVKATASEASYPLKESKRPHDIPKVDKKPDVFLNSQVMGNGVQNLATAEVKQGNLQNGKLLPGSHSMLITANPKEHHEQDKTVVSGLHHRRTRSSSTGLEGWQKPENSTANQGSSLDYWDTPGMPISARNGDDQVAGWLYDTAGTDGQSPSAHSVASKLNCWVVGAHLEKDASKTFAVYSVAVTDSDNNTWFVERRFRNFEQLHRNLRDLPHYNLQLPPKRFLSSSLDDSFVRDRCILLDKYLKDLLSIPSIAELHEVWDFLSVTSKNYAHSKSPSVMKTLAVNVDDAVDDMFRQLKEVSDGILRRVGGPPSPATDEASHFFMEDLSKPAGPLEASATISYIASHVDKERSEQLSDDEYGGPSSILDGDGTYMMEGWNNDRDSQMLDLMHRKISEADRNDRWPGKKIERGSSDAFSLEESTAGSEVFEEDPSVPPEWIPPKLTVPLLNLVDSIFQLQERGWIRRQVFWMAKQILQLGMGDAVDDWLVTQIQQLRREDLVASTISLLQETLWPGGIFITKKRKAESSSGVVDTSSKMSKQASQKGMDQSAFFESQLEASRCASVVHDVLVEGAPAPLVTLVGKKQYTRCAKDIYYFLQSSAFIKQLVYSILETLLTATFPELIHLIFNIRQGSGQFLV